MPAFRQSGTGADLAATSNSSSNGLFQQLLLTLAQTGWDEPPEPNNLQKG